MIGLKTKLPPSEVFVDCNLLVPLNKPRLIPSGPNSEPRVLILPATLKPLNLKLMSPTHICLIFLS